VLGEATLPCVAVLDGCVSGGAVGLGAHAAACVVTERTRVTLPGPAHGCLPESFAAFQLSRLPMAGVGTYLALTGAALSGQEMVELGLATHATESQSVERLVDELRHQRARHLGRTLRTLETALIEPKREAYTEAHALFYAEHIAECFTADSVEAILGRLDAGDTLWHAQAAHALRRASPLALALSHATLTAAASHACWTESLRYEAELCTAVLGAPDCVAGAPSLGASKRVVRRVAAEMEADVDESDADVIDEGDVAEEEVDEQTDARADAWRAAKRARDFVTANELRAALRADGFVFDPYAVAEPPDEWQHASVTDVTDADMRAYLPQ